MVGWQSSDRACCVRMCVCVSMSRSYAMCVLAGTPPERSDLPPIDRVYERASFEKTDAIYQLLGLQFITVFMLQLLARKLPYRDRLKNVTEIMYVHCTTLRCIVLRCAAPPGAHWLLLVAMLCCSRS